MPSVPTLYLHGTSDGCIGPEVVALAAAAAPDNVRIEHLDGVGHFLHREASATVNRCVVEFVTT